MRPAEAAIALAALAALPFGGCHCIGNGHIERTPVVIQPSDNIVNCACNVTFDNEACVGMPCMGSFEIELCLPPELRLPHDTDMGFELPDGGVATYAEKVNEYCTKDIANAGYHLIQVFSGGWCKAKAAHAPDGGRGESFECFAHEFHAGQGDATRSAEGVCPDLCPAVECNYGNCGNGVEGDDGTIHLDQCKCSVVDDHNCAGDPPGELPTVVFCRPSQPLPPQ